MNWQYTPYIFPLLAAAAISAWLAFYALKRRPAVGMIPFTVLMLAVAEWSFVYALRLLSADLAGKYFWARVRYLGILTVPTAWLAFVLQYTGREKWLTVRNIALLSIEPVVMMLLIWTNSWHGLYWSHIELASSGPLQVFSASYGAMRLVHVVYTYLLLLSSIALLVQMFIGSPYPYRGQVGVLLIGALVPFVMDTLSTYDLVPFSLDLAPFAFTVTGLTTAWGIFRFRLFDVVPVARNAVIDGLSDGMLVLDVQGHIIDINPAAQYILGNLPPDVLGRPISEVLENRPKLAEYCRGEAETRNEVSLGKGKARRVYDLRISTIRERRGHIIGRVVAFHDVTERKRAEANMVAQKQLFESLVAMARAVSKQPSLEATLQNALDMSAALTGAESGSIFLLSGEEVVTHSVLAREDATPAQRHDLIKSVMDRGLAGWVVHHRQPALIADTALDDRWLELPGMPGTVRSAMAVPIVSGSAVLGVLTLMHSDASHFTAEHSYLIQSAADQIKLALRNAQMYDEQRRLADRQTTLYEALRTIGERLDPDAVARAAVKVVARLTDWPAVSILLLEGDAARIIVPSAAGVISPAESRRLSIEQGVVGRAFRTTQIQHAPDVTVDPDYVAGDPAIRSELVLPLRRGERMLGMLDIASDVPYAFTEDDILLAKSLAEAIALALDNAHLYAETRQYADAVAAERIRLHALIESSRDGNILVGMDGQLLVVNARAIDLLRLPGAPEEWVNRTAQDVLAVLEKHAPRAAKIFQSEIHRFQQEDQVAAEGEFQVAPRTVHWLNLPVMSGEAPLGRLIVLHNVTEERLLEKMRDDLIHTMVHDLRNPLTAISGALSLLDKRITDDLSSNQQQLWDIAQANTARMVKLVTAILDISRLESRRMPLEHTLVSLSDLVAGVLDLQLPLAEEKGLHIENNVPSTLPLVWADAGLVERVLNNLIGNAIKFTPVGGAVAVAARLETTAQPRVLVSVSDTGLGIPADIRPRVFQKFVTGDQKGRGSGLGLAFCKMVMEAHDERIWVEDTSENGTTFTFTLPLPPATE